MSIDARVDIAPTVEQVEKPKTLTISEIINLLDSGVDRKKIKEMYQLTQAEYKHIFSHPKLKSIRVKRAQTVKIQLIDDTEDNQITLEQEIKDREAEVTSREVTPQIDNQSEIQD